MYLSSTTSLIAFVVGILSSMYLLYNGNKNNDVIFGIITLGFSFIQLFDLILRNNPTCNTTNHIFSTLTVVVLYLQAIGTCMAYYKNNTENNFFNSDSLNSYYIIFTIFIGYLMFWLNKSDICSKVSDVSNILKYGAYGKLKENYILLIMQIFFIGLSAMILLTEIYLKDYDTIINSGVRYAYLPFVAGVTFIYVMIKEVDVFKNMDVSKEINKISEKLNERKIPIDNPKDSPINPIKLLDHSASFVSVASFLATFIGPISIMGI
jgi:hypothetical protein|tara:strand:+ start:86 stop:880 length:795 start_codon:yes stop_codon:yes gene_type:complete